MSEQQAWLVKLEFERVQTYLFAVPELKSMIGANAHMGEVLRGRLTSSGFEREARSLPALAVSHGANLPQGMRLQEGSSLMAISDDPLGIEDDPHKAYEYGILARDGGHFQAVFPQEEGARAFVRGARALLGRELPGLVLSARTRNLVCKGGLWEKGEEDSDPVNVGEDVADLPQLQVCQVSGQGPASNVDQRHRNERRNERWISAGVEARRAAADEFDNGQSGDVLGMMREKLVDEMGLGDLPESQRRELFPSDFESVARSKYLAVLAADGNDIGSRSMKWRNEAHSQDFFQQEAHGERFFHQMRVVVRKALIGALKQTFSGIAKRIATEGRGKLPFRLMMLGGDDLLLVCDAVYVMPLLVAYVQDLQLSPLPDNKPLEIAAGVAVVKSKFPFHRSHALAEQLVKTAKRRAKETGGSTVDWLSLSEAWHEDVESVRHRDFRRSYSLGDGRTETLRLTRKPYLVLGAGMSLANLLQEAAKAVGCLPRSQLMALADGLERGRLQADWNIRLLLKDHRDALACVLPNESAWKLEHSKREHPEREHPEYVTALLDFLELYELERERNRREERTRQ